MRASPRVSVVLPVRDGADTLADALESIFSQSERDFELIVVDDGSGDETSAILGEYSNRDDRLRILSSGGAGIVAALNLGIREARGSLIARMDADDVSLEKRLQLQCDFLDAHPGLDLVSCCVDHWCEDVESRKGYAAYVDWTNGLMSEERIRLSRFVESPFAHPSVVFRKRLVEERGGYREGPFPEDYELWLRWLENGVRMEKMPDTLLLWRDHDCRLSRSDPRYSSEAFYRMKLDYLSRWLKKNNPFHPKIKVWGAGRRTRSRARLLEDHGNVITGFYDVDSRKTGHPRNGLIVHPIEEIPSPGKEFIVVMVGVRGAREKISSFLQSRNHAEGVDYVLAA